MGEIIELLDDMIETFINDTPDTDYQEGYLAALTEVRACVEDLAGRDE